MRAIRGTRKDVIEEIRDARGKGGGRGSGKSSCEKIVGITETDLTGKRKRKVEVRRKL